MGIAYSRNRAFHAFGYGRFGIFLRIYLSYTSHGKNESLNYMRNPPSDYAPILKRKIDCNSLSRINCMVFRTYGRFFGNHVDHRALRGSRKGEELLLSLLRKRSIYLGMHEFYRNSHA